MDPQSQGPAEVQIKSCVAMTRLLSLSEPVTELNCAEWACSMTKLVGLEGARGRPEVAPGTLLAFGERPGWSPLLPDGNAKFSLVLAESGIPVIYGAPAAWNPHGFLSKVQNRLWGPGPQVHFAGPGPGPRSLSVTCCLSGKETPRLRKKKTPRRTRHPHTAPRV